MLRRWRAFSFYLCMRKAARHLVVSIVPEGVELDHLPLQHPGLLRLPAAKSKQKSADATCSDQLIVPCDPRIKRRKMEMISSNITVS